MVGRNLQEVSLLQSWAIQLTGRTTPLYNFWVKVLTKLLQMDRQLLG